MVPGAAVQGHRAPWLGSEPSHGGPEPGTPSLSLSLTRAASLERRRHYCLLLPVESSRSGDWGVATVCLRLLLLLSMGQFRRPSQKRPMTPPRQQEAAKTPLDRHLQSQNRNSLQSPRLPSATASRACHLWLRGLGSCPRGVGRLPHFALWVRPPMYAREMFM